MEIRGHRLIPKRQLALFAGDVLLVSFSLYLGYRIKNLPAGRMGINIFVLSIYLYSFYLFDIYDFQRDYRKLNEFLRVDVAVTTGFLLNGLFFFFVPSHFELARFPFSYNFILLLFFLPCWRFIYSAIAKLKGFEKKALIIGAGYSGQSALSLIKEREGSGIKVVGFIDDDQKKKDTFYQTIPVLDNSVSIPRLVEKEGIKLLILAITHNLSEKLMEIIGQCSEKGTEVIDTPGLYERLANRVPFEHIGKRWLLLMNSGQSKFHLSRLKKSMDFIIALLLLIIFSPLLLIVSLLIKLSSKGPVFYLQERLGKNKVPFILIKFRSMKMNAEDKIPIWAEGSDCRVTKIGRLIRRWRIDELPQLINVLKGEMSLIGPRPEREYFIQRLEEKIPFYGQRFRMKPGISGWAQVNYSYTSSLSESKRKLEYELFYLKNNSLFLDFLVFLKTIKIVLLKKGSR